MKNGVEKPPAWVMHQGTPREIVARGRTLAWGWVPMQPRSVTFFAATPSYWKYKVHSFVLYHFWLRWVLQVTEMNELSGPVGADGENVLAARLRHDAKRQVR